MEYLVTMTTHVPDGTSEAAVSDWWSMAGSSSWQQRRLGPGTPAGCHLGGVWLIQRGVAAVSPRRR